ncbi:hypothetical protein H7142_01400 [Candidatus Saccharibacteria bacterium]|nr:hypothetical protein [Candidatus Saccharibacteria bacterium]
MNQLIYLAHAGHIPHEKADTMVIISPTMLLITTVAIVAMIVIAALVVQRQKPMKQRADDSLPK